MTLSVEEGAFFRSSPTLQNRQIASQKALAMTCLLNFCMSKPPPP
jgi:hypothetical protein